MHISFASAVNCVSAKPFLSWDNEKKKIYTKWWWEIQNIIRDDWLKLELSVATAKNLESWTFRRWLWVGGSPLPPIIAQHPSKRWFTPHISWRAVSGNGPAWKTFHIDHISIEFWGQSRNLVVINLNKIKYQNI